MDQETPRKAPVFGQWFVCAWIVASLAWYVLQFKPVLEPAAQRILRHLWH